MTFGGNLPHAVFTGALGDNATGGYLPAHAEVGNGVVTLWVASPQGWVQYFSVPAPEVTVKSAAQRITLEVRGQKYPILADPGAVNRALGLGVTGLAASAFDRPGLGIGADVGRGLNQVSAARSFAAGGGPAFIAAVSQSGARVSRLGYGAIAAIGCGGAVVAVVLALLLAVLLTR